MVRRGDDPLYDDRMKTVEQFIPDFDGKCGERIAKYILDDFFNKFPDRKR